MAKKKTSKEIKALIDKAIVAAKEKGFKIRPCVYVTDPVPSADIAGSCCLLGAMCVEKYGGRPKGFNLFSGWTGLFLELGIDEKAQTTLIDAFDNGNVADWDTFYPTARLRNIFRLGLKYRAMYKAGDL